MLIIYIVLPTNYLDISVLNVLLIHSRHFLPFRRRPNLPADLTASASLQPGLDWTGSR